MACSSPTEAMDVDEIERENKRLLVDILKFCKRSDHKSGENIVLLGRSGAGKSALINTVLGALAGSYFPRAIAGSGVALTRTLDLQWFPHCGLRQDDIKDSANADILKDLLPVLPNIFDAAGMGDEDTPAREEILRLLFGGYIQPGTNIKELEKLQEEHGVGELGHFLSTANPDWRIHKVVYVQSGREPVSKKLVQCILKVLERIDPRTAQSMFNCERFVVITKSDTIDDDDDDIEVLDRPVTRSSDEHRSSMSQSVRRRQNVTLKEFEANEREIAREFSIEGQMQFNSIRWTSCCDDVGFKSPKINNTALKFVKLMVTPGGPAVNKKPVVIAGFWKLKTLQLKKFLSNEQNVNVQPGFLLVAIAGLVFIIVLYQLFAKGL